MCAQYHVDGVDPGGSYLCDNASDEGFPFPYEKLLGLPHATGAAGGQDHGCKGGVVGC